MKRYLLIAAAVLAAVASFVAVIVTQDRQIKAQSQNLQAQSETIGTLWSANAAQNATIKQLRESKERDDHIIAYNAGELETLASHFRVTDRRLMEALRNASQLTLDSVLPADATDALCLQWHAASGAFSADNSGDSPAVASARASNSAAPDCSRWRKLTLRGVVEWANLLLQHAGAERLDKFALRKWAASLVP